MKMARSDDNVTRGRFDGVKDWLDRYLWLIVVMLAAFVIRAVYLHQISLQPGFTVPIVDEKWHWEWAHNILNKSFWGEGAYFRAPLYPYLLAFLAWISGSSIFWAKLLQSLLPSVTAMFVFLLADRLFSRKVAVVAGLAYACYGTLVFYETMFLIPALFLMLVVWGVYRVVRYRDSNSVRTWLYTGLIFGLAAISRPNVLLVIPFFMIWKFLWTPRRLSFLSRWKPSAILLAGLLIAVLPVTIRNVLVTGEFIFVSSQGGINLHLGNNAYADGLTMIMPEVDLDESVSWREFGVVTKAAAEKEAGRSLSEAELSSFWTTKALKFITSNPGKFLSLLWRKSLYLISGFENSDNADIYYQRTKSWLFSILVWDAWGYFYFPFGLLLPLALVGVYLNRDRRKELTPVYIFLLAYVPTIILFLVTARHRLPLVPFLIILASAAVVKMPAVWWKHGFNRELKVTLAAFVILVLVCNRTYYELGSGSAFQIHFNNGIQYERLGQYDKAEAEYRQADESYPYSATLINNLAFSQYRLGQIDIAQKNYRRALALDPGYAPIYNNLGLLVGERGKYDSAIYLMHTALAKYDTAATMPSELARVWMNIADMWEAEGEPDSAAAAYHEAMTVAPEYGPAYKKAAAYFARYGGYHIMDSLFKIGRHYEDLNANDYFNWGLSYFQRRRFTDAISKCLMALKYDPEMYQAWYLIGRTYYEAGEPKDSVILYLDRCLKLDSTFQQALNLKDLLEKQGGP